MFVPLGNKHRSVMCEHIDPVFDFHQKTVCDSTSGSGHFKMPFSAGRRSRGICTEGRATVGDSHRWCFCDTHHSFMIFLIDVECPLCGFDPEGWLVRRTLPSGRSTVYEALLGEAPDNSQSIQNLTMFQKKTLFQKTSGAYITQIQKLFCLDKSRRSHHLVKNEGFLHCRFSLCLLLAWP